MKPFFTIGAILCSIILIIPTMLVLSFHNEKAEQSLDPTTVQTSNSIEEIEQENALVAVYRTQAKVVEEVDLEDYIVGVVASEMFADFQLEALKAQALTARTYIVKHMLNPGDIQVPDGAIVTDTVNHQVYQNEIDLKEKWGKDFDWKIARIKEAVNSTRGQIITYDGTPITATFFSTSNGFTENSEDYWQNEFPYLRSVESPWDRSSPRFLSKKTISAAQFCEKLGVKLPSDGTVGKITARTKSGRVANASINGKIFSGREIREKLELDSTDFTWKRSGNNIIIETKGWGHGVGMSQYGAEGMAKEGKTYEEIIKHYYKGVQISPIEPFIATIAN